MSAVRVSLIRRRDARVLTSSTQVSVLWKDSPENPKNASGGGEKKESKAKKPASKATPKPSSKKADKETSSSDTD